MKVLFAVVIVICSSSALAETLYDPAVGFNSLSQMNKECLQQGRPSTVCTQLFVGSLTSIELIYMKCAEKYGKKAAEMAKARAECDKEVKGLSLDEIVNKAEPIRAKIKAAPSK